VVEVIQEQSGQKPGEVVSDSGYCSDANLGYLEEKKIEGFVAVDRESYRDREKPCPRGPLPKEATRVDRMRRKLQIKKGAAIYSTRKKVVEPVFGQIKEARGFRHFLLRGTEEGTRGVGDRLSHAQHSEVTSALLWIEEDKKARKLYT
jgi:hypothetical protein